MSDIEIMATLWPDMHHYEYFAEHPWLNGIRLNTAMANVDALPKQLEFAVAKSYGTPLYFDVKGRQLRITKIYPNTENLELDIESSYRARYSDCSTNKGRSRLSRA